MSGLAFSPDGRILAKSTEVGSVGMEAGSVVLYDPSRRVQLAVLPIGPDRNLRGLAFNRDGLLAVADNDVHGDSNAVSLWDPVRHTKLQTLPQDGEVKSVAFGPDGRTLVAGRSSTIAVWDVAARVPLGDFAPRIGTLTSVAFDQRRQLVAAVGDGGVSLLNVDLASWQRLGCELANRNLTAAEWQQFLAPQPYRRTCSALPAG